MKRANSNVTKWYELSGRCFGAPSGKLKLVITKHRYFDKSTHYIVTMGRSGSYDIEPELAKKLISICNEVKI